MAVKVLATETVTYRLTVFGYLSTIRVFKGRVVEANAKLGIIGWTLPQLYVYGQAHGWKIERQDEYLRATRRKKGLCIKCGKKTVTKTLCLKHAIQAREANKTKKGWYRPYQCASRKAEDKVRHG